MSNINSSIKHAENLFEDYPDIVKVEQLKTMLRGYSLNGKK